MIPKGFPHHPHHFFRQNWTNYTPIWAHFVACMMEFSCILVIPCSENSVFLERKNWSQKASQNMQKASHIIKLPQCPFPNHIFTAVHTRFTRILACACIFRLGLYVDLHGAGLRNNLGGQKIEKKSFFSLLFHKLVRKGFPHHLHHFFLPKIHQFYPNWSPVWGMHSEFWLCFAYAVLEKTLFSQNRNATKPVFHSRIS